MDVALTDVISMVLCLMAAAGFSLVDAVLQLFGDARAQKAFDDGNKRFELFAQQSDRVRASLTLGKYVFLLAFVLLVGLALSPVIGPWATLPLVFLVVVVFVEIGPRSMAHARNRELASPLLHIVKPWIQITRPITWTMVRSVKAMAPKQKEDPDADQLLEEDLALMVNAGAKNASLTELKERILHSVFEFGDTVVREVMVPRNDVVKFASTTSIAEALKTIVEGGHSRIPVFGELDEVIGVLYVKDLLGHIATHGTDAPCDIPSLVRPAHFIPDSKHLNDLFTELQREHVHIAIVIDEHGGFAGIVTMEDIIEEFFGEIHDEHDVEKPLCAPLGEGRYLTDGRMPVADLENLLGIRFPDDAEYDTLGGFVVGEAGRVPLPGTKIAALGLTFVITRATEKRVLQVEIRPDDVVSSGSWRIH